MNDITNYTRMPQSSQAANASIDKNSSSNAANATAAQPTVVDAAKAQTTAATTVASNINLSNVAQKALAQPGFDRAKVDAIKQAIKNGSYAIDPRRIAKSFMSMEQALPE
jgi:negative regulator of flagellin synthesis FlgM